MPAIQQVAGAPPIITQAPPQQQAQGAPPIIVQVKQGKPGQKGQGPPPPPGRGGQSFEQLHPRGRGGKWIVKKGAGYGGGGPDQTTTQLQQRLRQLGYNIPVDGKFGTLTEEAVKAFQQKYGLDTSGGVDTATLEVLRNPPETSYQQAASEKGKKKGGTPAPPGATPEAARKLATDAATKEAAAKTKEAKAAGKARSRALKAKAGKGGTTAGGSTKRTPSAAEGLPGLSTTIGGVGHLGDINLQQGLGMSGPSNPAVANLQAVLNAFGAKLDRDGRFGPKTLAAVKKIQQGYGLKVDGVVGPETKGLLLGLQQSLAKTTKATTERKTTVRKIKKLREEAFPAEGLYPGEVVHHGVPTRGWGNQPSLSIKDARPEGEPSYDKPIWRGGAQMPEDLTIRDGRDKETPVTAELRERLDEAVEVRKTATSSSEFVRARAREQALRERLQEQTTQPAQPKQPKQPKPSAALKRAQKDAGVKIQAHNDEEGFSSLEDQLEEAVAARKAASGGDFVYARAREEHLRHQLQEIGGPERWTPDEINGTAADLEIDLDGIDTSDITLSEAGLWIQKAQIKKGALHADLGVPPGKKIPIGKIRAAAKAKGTLGRRARLALTLMKVSRRHRAAKKAAKATT